MHDLPATLIVDMADAMTAQGISCAVQVEVFQRIGIGIGGGGGGSSFPGEPKTVCGYCRATGNGGHGGNCPEGLRRRMLGR